MHRTRGAQGQSEEHDISDEDAIHLLDKEGSLELIQCDPTVNDGWYCMGRKENN